MKTVGRRQLLLVFAALLAGTSSARAGIIATTSSGTNIDLLHMTSSVPKAVSDVSTCKPLRPLAPRTFSPAWPPNVDPLIPSSLEPTAMRTDEADAAPAATLPPGPGSTALALSGLLSLGAVQLGRNVRKLHLTALPEWYHDGGPTQVGHASPVDLSFSLAAMPICRFEVAATVADESVLPIWYLQRVANWHYAFEHFPPSTESRGPPAQV